MAPKAGEEGPPAPATYDRLSLDWNKATVKRFKDTLASRDIQAFVVRDPLNIMYLTGYWHTTTERPQAAFMNKDDADPWFMYPGLDRDSVTTWWFGGGRMYFDFLHGEGAFPHEGKVQQGETVDLFRFMLEGIKEHKVQGTRIGIDGELYPAELAKAKDVLPGVEWVNVADTLMKMRWVKTPEELALWRRAYVYFDRAHGFARDYILTHGTDVTDYEVGQATTTWINDILYSELDLKNGAMHHGVASGIGVGCRVGPLTAYPHPNQPLTGPTSSRTAAAPSIRTCASSGRSASTPATCRSTCQPRDEPARTSPTRSTSTRWRRACRSTSTTGPGTGKASRATSRPTSPSATTRCCARTCASPRSPGSTTRSTGAASTGATPSWSARSLATG